MKKPYRNIFGILFGLIFQLQNIEKQRPRRDQLINDWLLEVLRAAKMIFHYFIVYLGIMLQNIILASVCLSIGWNTRKPWPFTMEDQHQNNPSAVLHCSKFECWEYLEKRRKIYLTQKIVLQEQEKNYNSNMYIFISSLNMKLKLCIK